MFLVGICGEIGAGKTLVSQMFCEFPDTYRIGIDEITHEVIKHPDIQVQLFKRWSKKYASIKSNFENGLTISREDISGIVFEPGNESELRYIEDITEHIVRAILLDRLFYYDNERTKMVVLDAPLLFEADLDSICDATVYVTAPMDTRVRRCSERDEAAVVCPISGTIIGRKKLSKKEICSCKNITSAWVNWKAFYQFLPKTRKNCRT